MKGRAGTQARSSMTIKRDLDLNEHDGRTADTLETPMVSVLGEWRARKTGGHRTAAPRTREPENPRTREPEHPAGVRGGAPPGGGGRPRPAAPRSLSCGSVPPPAKERILLRFIHHDYDALRRARLQLRAAAAQVLRERPDPKAGAGTRQPGFRPNPQLPAPLLQEHLPGGAARGGASAAGRRPDRLRLPDASGGRGVSEAQGTEAPATSVAAAASQWRAPGRPLRRRRGSSDGSPAAPAGQLRNSLPAAPLRGSESAASTLESPGRGPCSGPRVPLQVSARGRPAWGHSSLTLGCPGYPVVNQQRAFEEYTECESATLLKATMFGFLPKVEAGCVSNIDERKTKRGHAKEEDSKNDKSDVMYSLQVNKQQNMNYTDKFGQIFDLNFM
ncbi:uncharacterized protein AAEQ78_002918 [Lycaon pictus]